jgi:molybdopterin converting factor subunit 1
MIVHLRFFAGLRERLRRSEADWTLPAEASVEDLWSSLLAAHPELEPMTRSISFAVNREYVERAHRLHAGDEVALIPPVSGG